MAVPPGHVRFYAPPRVVYAAPMPVLVYPRPAVYEPVYPVYSAPAAPSVGLGVTVPLL
ncbi:MAG: hypothetical protein ACHQK9_22795 [Reyranellales bacterium]